MWHVCTTIAWFMYSILFGNGWFIIHLPIFWPSSCYGCILHHTKCFIEWRMNLIHNSISIHCFVSQMVALPSNRVMWSFIIHIFTATNVNTQIFYHEYWMEQINLERILLIYAMDFSLSGFAKSTTNFSCWHLDRFGIYFNRISITVGQLHVFFE